jgi:hypothetical protein
VREWYEAFQNANWGSDHRTKMATCFSAFPRTLTGTWATESACSANSPARLKTDGTEAPRPTDEARLWVEEAFAEFDVPASSNAKVALRLGRQEFEFGSGRLVDVREGPNVRQAFDGFSAILDSGPWYATTFVTQPVLNRPQVFDDPTDNSRTFWGVYATDRFAPGD